MSAITPSAEIGHNESSAGAASLALVLTANVAVGAQVVIGAANRTPARTVTTVTDTQGNTYTVRGSLAGTNSRSTQIDCTVTTALSIGDTITVNFSGSQACAASAFSFVGQAGSPLDQSGTNSAAGTSSFTVASGSTVQADEISVVCYGYGSSSGTPFSSNGGYTAVGDRFFSTGGIWLGYKILTATGVETAAQTCGASNSFAGTIATYKGGTPTAARPVAPTIRQRARQALTARRRHRQAVRLRAPSVTTATPLVRQRVVTRPDRRRQLLARRKHRDVTVVVRPRVPALISFVRPSITVIRRKRAAVVARRRHHQAVVVRPPRPAFYRPVVVVVHRARTAMVARRRHRQPPILVRPKPLATGVRQRVVTVRHKLTALLTRRRHRVRQTTRPIGGGPPAPPPVLLLTPDPVGTLALTAASTGTVSLAAGTTGTVALTADTTGTVTLSGASEGTVPLAPATELNEGQ